MADKKKRNTKSMKDNEAKDNMHTDCKKCEDGTYVETGQHDDMDGRLHCIKCGHGIRRWANLPVEI